MRALFFVPILFLASLVTYSQEPKTIINCWIANGRVNYGHLGELLPESVKNDILVDPRKDFNMRDGNIILLWLEQRGWKLSAVDNTTSGFNGNTSSTTTYVLSKEIYLDDAARDLFLRRLEEIGNKGH
jgi:hypothetical protein